MDLKVIPDEVWGFKVPVKVLDLSKNAIREVSLKIGSLKVLVNKPLSSFCFFASELCQLVQINSEMSLHSYTYVEIVLERK